ncbi:MAG: CcoQ/FixQ family Cbb3-type cytochrome c oxidase assembly chaperone [Bdellovibrionales bacterium]|nr:CcoQ/FixQ family Cbb3-type cytochrome c oxidase assembly chaperone [Bdellovibrionales bacterium]
MKDLVPYIDTPFATLIVTPLLLVMFIVIIWWVYRKDRKHIYNSVSKFPLDSDKLSEDINNNI